MLKMVTAWSTVTRPIHIFVDELIKPKLRMPTVLRDSSELIQLFENTVLPHSNCFLDCNSINTTQNVRLYD